MYPDPKSYRKRDPVLPPQKWEYGKLAETVPKTPWSGLGMRGMEVYPDPPTMRRYEPHDGGIAPGARRGGS